MTKNPSHEIVSILRTELQAAVERGDEPYSAVIADHEGEILAFAGNCEHSASDPTAHAEVCAIRMFALDRNSRDMSDLILYCSAEPCPMCRATAEFNGISCIEVINVESPEEERLEVVGLSPNLQSLVVENVRLTECPGLWSIGMRDGVIDRVEQYQPGKKEVLPAAARLNARGCVFIPPLVEAHIHLEKAYLESRKPNLSGTLQEAIKITGELKKQFTIEDMVERARAVLDRSVRKGVAVLRAQVEVDPILGLRALEAVVSLRQEYADKLEIQIVAFPQEGILQSPGTEELLKSACTYPLSAIGGVPYNDTDPDEHLGIIFRLAASTGLDLDIHTDFSDNPALQHIKKIISNTKSYGYTGRVMVSHLTSLGSMDPSDIEQICQDLAELQITVATLPMTDLYLGARNDHTAPRRGLTPVKALLSAGVPMCCGSNNIRNAFTPFGNGDPIVTAHTLAIAAQMGSKAEQDAVLRMVTSDAAKALGVQTYGIAPGCTANGIILDITDPELLISEIPERRWIIREGRIIHRSYQ